MHPRTAALGAALCLAIGWGTGLQMGKSSAPPAATVGGPRPLGSGSPVDSVAPAAADLRRRLDRSPGPARPGRNPFRFGAARPSNAEALHDRRPSEDRPAATGDDTVSTGVAALFLAGIATSAGAEVPVHTAIVNDGRTLLFLSVGDTLPGGVTVVDISETAVTLRDESGGERTLRLR